MYIHKTYSIYNTNAPIKIYKQQLKELSKINLRRSSKFNILAVIGALQCMKGHTLSDNMGIYIASEYGSITSVKKVLEDVSKNELVMPFDFLNINSNNVSFYVSQALQSQGKNMVITSEYASIEKVLELAAFELYTKEVKDILVGHVDESLEDIDSFEKYTYVQNSVSQDISAWMYINQEEENALCHIDKINTYTNIEELQKDMLKMEADQINFYNYAQQFKNTLLENIPLPKKISYLHFNALFPLTMKKIIHLSCDQNNKFSLIQITKI